MGKRTSMRLDDELQMLEDRARSEFDSVLPAERYRTDLYRMALKHLLDSLENHNKFEGSPQAHKQFNTRVIRARYEYGVDVVRP